MFTNICGSSSKDNDWYDNSVITNSMNYRDEQHVLDSRPNQHNQEHNQSNYNNVLYNYQLSDASNNHFENGNNGWQYSRSTSNSNDLCVPKSNTLTDIFTHSHTGNAQKTLNEISPYQEPEKSIALYSNSITLAAHRQHPPAHTTTSNNEQGVDSSIFLSNEDCPMNNSKSENSPHGHRKTTEGTYRSQVNLIQSGIHEASIRSIKVKRKESSLLNACAFERNASGNTKHIFQSNKKETIKDQLVEHEGNYDDTCDSSSDTDSDNVDFPTDVSNFNCKTSNCDIHTATVNNGNKYFNGDDIISCDDIQSQLDKFYKFECNKCQQMNNEIITFSSHKLLAEHCQKTHNSEGEVECCGQIMWQEDELLKHMQGHKTLLRCVECHKSFNSKVLWKRHMKQHLPKMDIGPYCCLHCDKKFSSKYGLANHLNLHLPEEERPFKCRHCNKGFGAKHAMSKHERTHLPDEERLSYICDKCGKRFGYASTLDGHQKHVHQNERPYVCHVCAKTFPIKGALTYHLTTHEVQDRVQCTDCGIWLKNEKILRIHKKCHQGNLYACPHCDKVSNTRNNLRMHMKRHSSDRPHPCPLCPRAFKTPRDLKTHLVQHTGQKPYSCPFCPKTFASPSNFYAHRKMKHKMATIEYEEPVPPALILQNY